jgi:ubiquinone/menaquinone biosynthesis C-methylase UbiE
MPRGAPSDRLQETYERRAELLYAAPSGPPDPSLDRKFERIWSLLESCLPCEAFLDAGCGAGTHLAAFASVRPRPGRIVGTDISARILQTAEATARQAGVETELLQANLEALPFGDGSFDLVLCTQVIEHLLAPDGGMRELARVIRPGGRLVISTDNRGNLVSRALNGPRSIAVRALRLRGRRQAVHFPHTNYAIPEFEHLLKTAGFDVEHLETFRFHLDHPLDAASRPSIQRALNRVDKALPPHRLGDIVAAIARR